MTAAGARLGVGLALAALGACAVGPSFHKPAPPAATDYGSAPVRGETAAETGAGGGAQRFVTGMDIPAEWWRLFGSPALAQLVGEALTNNPSVAAAQAALHQARELYLAQRASFFPSIQAGVSGLRAENAAGTVATPTVLPQSTAYYDLYTADVSVSYLPDVFGGTRRATETARAEVDSARFQLEAARLSLSSNVVVTAVEEASLRGQIEATTRLLEVEHRLTETVRGQRKLGTASELDLLAQLAAEAGTAASLPPLQRELGETRDALTALVGRLPSEEPRATFRLADLVLPRDLPVSLPSRLVEQRPDVLEAEAELHAASAQVGVALADMLPQFTLTAQTGSAALKLGQLFGPYTGFWDAGASLAQTLFDGGALRARHRAAEAALDQAAAQYRAAVIQACQNVADSLRALDSDAAALRASSAAARASQRAFELARGELALGAVSEIAVLEAEQNYRQAELALIQARANRYADTAALYQALGGGWWNRPGGKRP